MSDQQPHHQHGNGGVYHAGSWVDMEDLCKLNNTSNAASSPSMTKKKKGIAPDGRSRNTTTADPEGLYDVVVIGAGVIGCSISRELAKTSCRVLLLDGEHDVTQGASKANSGVIHGGYNSKPGTLHAKYAHRGCLMFPELDRHLHFGFNRCGSLVLAVTQNDVHTLEMLEKSGRENGIFNLSIIHGNANVRKIEPHVSESVIAALFSPDAGVVVPYEYCIAVAENACANGVELYLKRVVTGVEWAPSSDSPTGAATPDSGSPQQGDSGGGGGGEFHVTTQTISSSTSTTITKKVRARCVINCAGRHADAVAAMFEGGGRQQPTEAKETAINNGKPFKIMPRYGDYLILNKSEGRLCSRVLFPCPHPIKGKGILVQPTLWGNLLLGPTADDTPRQEEEEPAKEKGLIKHPVPLTNPEDRARAARHLVEKSKLLIPDFDESSVIHSFAGVRARVSSQEVLPDGSSKWMHADWIIRPSHVNPCFFHVAGIDSPGLTASPAIAVDVVSQLRQQQTATSSDGDNDNLLKQKLNTPNPRGFNPHRAAIIIPKKFEKSKDGKGGGGSWILPSGKTLVFPDNDNNNNPTTSRGKEEEDEEVQHQQQQSRVVCLCERVTEAEIVDCLHRELPIEGTQEIRRRCRAGQGWCQGRRCERAVASIIAREKGLPSVDDVPRRPWPASSLLPRRWATRKEKTELLSPPSSSKL